MAGWGDKEWHWLTVVFTFHLASGCKRAFPCSSVGKESACNAGDPGLIPGLGRSPGEGIGCPLQYFWASLVAQLVKNPPAMQETWVRSLGWEGPLEKGNLPTPVFWPGDFHWLYSLWGCKESDMTERLSLRSGFKICLYICQVSLVA